LATTAIINLALRAALNGGIKGLFKGFNVLLCALELLVKLLDLRVHLVKARVARAFGVTHAALCLGHRGKSGNGDGQQSGKGEQTGHDRLLF
jgi:hypothetical protein